MKYDPLFLYEAPKMQRLSYFSGSHRYPLVVGIEFKSGDVCLQKTCDFLCLISPPDSVKCGGTGSKVGKERTALSDIGFECGEQLTATLRQMCYREPFLDILVWSFVLFCFNVTICQTLHNCSRQEL